MRLSSALLNLDLVVGERAARHGDDDRICVLLSDPDRVFALLRLRYVDRGGATHSVLVAEDVLHTPWRRFDAQIRLAIAGQPDDLNGPVELAVAIVRFDRLGRGIAEIADINTDNGRIRIGDALYVPGLSRSGP